MKPLFIALALATAPVLAHEGEDHGAPPTPAAQAVAPRASSTSDEFELVAVIDRQRLLVYLDQASTNAPVEQADIEVEGAGIKARAKSLGGGVYELPAAGVAAPGKHALIFTVQAGDSADLLEAQLAVPESPAEVAGTANGRGKIVWGGGLLGSLVGVAALMRLRRRDAAEAHHA